MTSLDIKRFAEDNKKTLLFFLIALAVSLFLPLNWSDDAVFFKDVAEKSYRQFITNSARPFTDTATYFFIKYPLAWRILNPIILVLFSKCLSWITHLSHDHSLFIFIVSCIPAMCLVDAGFIATTVNYLFPVALALCAFLPLIYSFKYRIINAIKYFLAIPLIAYASDMQQMCVVMIVVYTAYIAYYTITKRFPFYALWCLLLSAVGFAKSVFLNTVGTNNRFERSCAQYFPSFAELSIFQKIELGFSSTFYELTSHCRQAYFIFLAFILLLAIITVIRKKPTIYKSISLFSVLLVLLTGIGNAVNLPFLRIIYGNFKNYKMNLSEYTFAPLADLYYILLSILIIITIYNLIDKKQFLLSAAVLILGVGSRMIMGFSPTVWASGYRTFFILVTAFIVVSSFVLDKFKEEQSAVQRSENRNTE